MLDQDHAFHLRLTPSDLAAKKPDAVITQLEGPIRKLEDHRVRALAQAEGEDRDAHEAESRLGQPFPDQARLEQLRRRYQQITDELNSEAESAETSAPPGPAVREVHDSGSERRRAVPVTPGPDLTL